MNWKKILFVSLTCGFSVAVLADDMGKSIYNGSVENRLDTLSSIQPGLGVIMHEIGYRITALYGAANGGNWALAQYELKELIEAQEVAEFTRPKRAGMLKSFETKSLMPLKETIMKKDIDMFNKQFSSVVNACNNCHKSLGYGYIQYQLPKNLENSVLDFGLKTEPKK